MLQFSAVLRYITKLPVTSSAARAFSQSTAPARSILSTLMGPSTSFRGAAAKEGAAAAPSNTVEAFFAAKPHPTGNHSDLKNTVINQTARHVANDSVRAFPNVFETVLKKSSL